MNNKNSYGGEGGGAEKKKNAKQVRKGMWGKENGDLQVRTR
jgi:hypothetical protein